ncbi:hypothetical protein R4K55_12475 [Brachyspira alvinipulli]|uniref:hypothetical protein n=1 Tax=Brachyspira alvinipulli TaxID=84379 RepID=UPI0030047928
MASKNNNKTNIEINKDLNNKLNQKNNDNEDLDTEIKNNKYKNNKTTTNINDNLNNDFNPKDNNNNKDLDNELKDEEKRQIISEKKLIFCLKKAAIIVCFGSLIAIFITYIYHLIFPNNLRWLSENNLSEIKSIAVAVGSGVFSSLVSSYFFNSKK